MNPKTKRLERRCYVFYCEYGTENVTDAIALAFKLNEAQSRNPVTNQHENQQDLIQVSWFHGTISRELAEMRLSMDGEFLLRQSLNCPGQMILSVMEDGKVKHIQLTEEEKFVRVRIVIQGDSVTTLSLFLKTSKTKTSYW